MFRRSDETTDWLLIAGLLHYFGPTAEVIVPLGSRSSQLFATWGPASVSNTVPYPFESTLVLRLQR